MKLLFVFCGVLDGITCSRLQPVTILKSIANQGHLPKSLVSLEFLFEFDHMWPTWVTCSLQILWR